ncbi:MAG: DUF2971 domain-containing protein [Acidimicrobiia bacterium]
MNDRGRTIDEMSSVLGSSDPLDSALSTIVDDALSDWDRIQGDAPDLLYHYTDVVGLIGICSSGSLWATNLRFMNDAKELAHSRKLMLKVLAEAKDKAGFPAQLELIEEIERTAMAGWVGYPDFYATSFTANGDLLSQWRGYGSSGGGYAIGFDAARLISPPSPYPQPDRFLNRVIYEEETQLRVLRATAEKMLELFATVDPSSPEMTGARARLFAALGEVVGFVFSFKDPAWAEEQEWRSVYVLPEGELDGVEFRPDGGIAVPYVTLAMGTDPDGRLPIREIVQGPRLDNETGVRSLELLMASNGYSDVKITVSSVPLRP